MKSYCLIFKIKPEFTNNHPHSVAGAYAAVYAFCDTEKEAETMAINHLRQHEWEVLTMENVSEMTPKHLVPLNENQAKGYREAKTNGISFVILDAWPKFLDHIFSSHQPSFTPNKKDL